MIIFNFTFIDLIELLSDFDPFEMFYLKFLSLFLINILLYISLIKVKKNYLDKFLASDSDYLSFLHFFYSNNIYITITKILLYIFFNLGIFIIIRYYRLYNIINLNVCFDILNISYSNIVLFILFIIMLTLYKLLLYNVFFKEVLKLHVFLSRIERYGDYRMEISQELDGIFRIKILDTIAHFLSKMLSNKNDYDYFVTTRSKIVNDPKDYYRRNVFFTRIKLYLLFYIRPFVISKPKLASFVRKIQHSIYDIERYQESYKYIVEVILLIILLNDLYNRELHYIFYALFWYLLVQIWRKIKIFARTKDPVLDDILYKYFYEGVYIVATKEDDDKYDAFIKKKSTDEVIEFLSREKPENPEEAYIKDLLEMSKKQTNIEDYKKPLTEYILSNFMVSYYRDIVETQNANQQRNKYRLILIILTLFILSISYLYNDRYYFLFNSIKLPLIVILIPLPIMIWCIKGHTTIKDILTTIDVMEVFAVKLSNKQLLLFKFMLLCYLAFFSILYVKSNIPFYYTEIVFNYKITLVQVFNENTKINFIFKYLEHLINNTDITILDKINIVKYFYLLNLQEIIDITQSIDSIKIDVDILFNMIITLLSNNTVEWEMPKTASIILIILSYHTCKITLSFIEIIKVAVKLTISFPETSFEIIKKLF
jgi:hypothetical protein